MTILQFMLIISLNYMKEKKISTNKLIYNLEKLFSVK